MLRAAHAVLPLLLAAAAPLAARLLARVAALAAVGATDNAPGVPRGVDRGYLAPAAADARALLLAWMRAAGMRAHVDGAGNVVGRLVCGGAGAPGGRGGAGEDRRTLVMGSHHDTVANGGAWDGAYGVLAAIGVAEVVAARGGGVCALPFDLEVVSFDDEEGNSPFASTNTGAKAYAGAAVDVGGTGAEAAARRAAFAAAHRRAFGGGGGGGGGGGPEDVDSGYAAVLRTVRGAARPGGWANVLAFLELHIEQGPVLEAAAAAVGVVTAIAGQTRMSLRFAGRAGHAGTVPMPLRSDALVAAAAIVGEAEAAAVRAGDGVVATVGVLRVEGGGGTNVVPGRVMMSLDVRAAADDVRRAVVAEILDKAAAAAEARGAAFEASLDHEADAVEMAGWLQEVAVEAVRNVAASEAAAAAGRVGAGGWCAAAGGNASRPSAAVAPTCRGGGGVVRLPSGAGHDTQLIARVADSAMLFVRCAGGISHSPLERVADGDAIAGALALLQTVDGVADRVRARVAAAAA
jgi:allantoate deiminase